MAPIVHGVTESSTFVTLKFEVSLHSGLGFRYLLLMPFPYIVSQLLIVL